jgi:tRNA G10  N-methylase Trm11
LAEFRAIRPDLKTDPIECGPALLVDDPSWDGAVAMQTLGGTVKLGDVFLEVPTGTITAEAIADFMRSKPRGEKAVFGFSVHGGTPAVRKRLEKLAIDVKREISSRGFPARWVTSEKGATLSPAAVAKLHLTTDGYDVVLLVHGDTTSIGLTTHVQDADAWSFRDAGRPFRDDENGMLPPKLARMLVNLAETPKNGTILDPFCGSGTLLMEAALATRAKSIVGSDMNAEQVAATAKNLEWCVSERVLRTDDMVRFKIFRSDVRSLTKHLKTGSVDRVVTEGHLGPMLSGHETLETLKRNAAAITDLWRDAFASLHPLMNAGGRVVCIWPSFKSSHGIVAVDLSDDPALTKRFRVLDLSLAYHRPGQRVMRRIAILEVLA